jgi:hypothetical protein
MTTHRYSHLDSSEAYFQNLVVIQVSIYICVRKSTRILCQIHGRQQCAKTNRETGEGNLNYQPSPTVKPRSLVSASIQDVPKRYGA